MFLHKDEVRRVTFEENQKQEGIIASIDDYEREFFVRSDLKVQGILRTNLYPSFKNIINRGLPSSPKSVEINVEQAERKYLK